MADIPRDKEEKKLVDKGDGWILQHMKPRPPAGTPQPAPGHTP